MDLETFTPYKKGRKPRFDLYHYPKEIVNTNPHVRIECPKWTRFSVEKHREFRKTKHRPYLPYQICVDDIDELAMYKKGGYVDQMYTSDWKEAVKRVNTQTNRVPHVYTNVAEIADPIRFRPARRMVCSTSIAPHEFEQWKHAQNTASITRQKVHCGREKPVTTRLTADDRRYIQNLVQDNKLRNCYDKLSPGYAGYCSTYPPSNSMEIKQFYRIDPFVTTLQVFQNNFKKF